MSTIYVPPSRRCRVVYNDGGRATAGYKGKTGDCVCRAVAIATGKPYQEVYDELIALGKNEQGVIRRSHARTGVRKETTRAYLASLGWQWKACMSRGTGCQVHLRPDELPGGTIIVRLTKHISCVKDGVIYDIGDPSRGGTRCVYGYWYKPGV